MGKSHVGIEIFCPVFSPQTQAQARSAAFTPPAFPSLILLFSNKYFDFLFIHSLPVSDVGYPWVVSGLRNDDICDE